LWISITQSITYFVFVNLLAVFNLHLYFISNSQRSLVVNQHRKRQIKLQPTKAEIKRIKIIKSQWKQAQEVCHHHPRERTPERRHRGTTNIMLIQHRGARKGTRLLHHQGTNMIHIRRNPIKYGTDLLRQPIKTNIRVLTVVLFDEK